MFFGLTSDGLDLCEMSWPMDYILWEALRGIEVFVVFFPLTPYPIK
jgi:hypothetical protein